LQTSINPGSATQSEGNNEAGKTNMKPGEKAQVSLKLTSNIYTISYCAFMVANKQKFKLKLND